MHLSYTPPPTIEKFMLWPGTDLVRCVVGPVGCLPAETEFLTPQGWRRMDAYMPGTLVAQWHRNGVIEFVHPDQYVVAPCAEMIRFHTGPDSVDMVLSAEHRVPHLDWKGAFAVKQAWEIEHKRSRRTIPTTFSGPSGPGLAMDDDLIRFAVMMHADGHYPSAGYHAKVVLRRERKKLRLRALLERMGLTWHETSYPARPTETLFSFIPPYVGKTYGPEWYRANAHQLSVVMDEVDHWDGMPDHAERRFSSTRRADADFIQYAAHACGLRATIRQATIVNPDWAPQWVVHIRSGDNPKNRAQIREQTEIHRVPTSDGFKYCFTVPTGFFIARHNDFVFVTGNSGKSMGCIMELFRRACMQAPHNGVRYTRFALVRNTLKQLRTTVLPDVQTYLGPICKLFVTDGVIQLRADLPDGTKLQSDWLMVPLDTVEDQQRLLSTQLSGAWVNECREVPIELISALLGRLGRYPSAVQGGPTWFGLVMDSNPWGTDSAYHESFVLDPRPGWVLFHQPSGIGPDAENVENLPPGYYDNLAGDRDVEWAAVHVESQWGTSNAGQAVFRKTFHAPTHVKNMHLQVNPHRPLLVGVDFGRTPCAAICQPDNYGRLLVLKEVVTENMGLYQMLEEHLRPVLLQEPFIGKRVIVIGDPAGNQKSQLTEETPFDVLKALGFTAIPAPTNNIQQRLLAVEKLLRQQISGEPGLQINREGCPVLVTAMGDKYRFKKKRDGQLEDNPEKLHPWSDIMDALQYACLGTNANLVGRVILRDQRLAKSFEGRPRVAAGGWT